MDIVERVGSVEPIAFYIINLEADILRNPDHPSAIKGQGSLGTRCRSYVGASSYQVGWMGDKSVPVTIAFGNRSAISMAQRPVPVPMSRIRLGFSRGARCNSPLRRRVMTWCCRSSRSSSGCSSHVSWKGVDWELECKNLPHHWAVDNLCFSE